MLNKLDLRERKVIRQFTTRIRKSLGNNLISIILFGSKIRGDYSENSDIDLLIIVKKKKLLVRKKIYNVLFEIDPYYKFRISPLIYSKYEYKKNEELKSTFLDNLKKEGVTIWRKI